MCTKTAKNDEKCTAFFKEFPDELKKELQNN
jgi:hypothetical protein